MRVYFMLSAIFAMWTENVQAQMKSIDEIRFEKVGIETSLADFLKQHPKAKQEKTDEEKFSVKLYSMIDKDEESDSGFKFFEGKMTFMLVSWTNNGLNNVGGADLILKGIVAKYGEADENSPGMNGGVKIYLWINPTNSNRLMFRQHDKGLTISMSVKNLNNKLDELKAKSSKKKIDN